MVAPTGFGLSEVGDVEVFPHGEEIHLFHLTLPNHDLVQHAVSTDGLSWTAQPPALRTGDPGDCDDDMIWTMSVTERAGRYYMVYTALAYAEGGRVQRTALATSDDLLTWTKHPANPVGAADARWYETDPAGRTFVSWRDPKPILVGDTYYAAVCAREREGPFLRRGCVGLLASSDLVAWEPRPPLFAPRLAYDLECPQVFEIDGRFYLTAALMEDRTQRYWTADRFAGPYHTPPGGNELAPRGHYAGRVCRWRGLDLYFCWHRAANDWPGIRNPHGKFIPPPLVLTPAADGRLARRPYPGWEEYKLAPAGGGSGAAWGVDAPAGLAIRPQPAADDVCLTGELTVAAAAGGLALRLAEDDTGYFLRLTPGTAEVTLLKWLPGRRAEEAAPWFSYAEVQHGRLSRPLERGRRVAVQALAVGPYIELALDGEVVIAAVTGERQRGQVGLWAEGGAVTLDEALVTPMRRPAYRHGA